VPYLIEREGTICENLEETHLILKQIRRELDAACPDRMLLAEANQWPADVRPYFGDGDECHMAFHFPLMPRMFMAIRQEDRHPIVEILRQTPEIPENCQWAMFVRNHDELTLEMVTDEERDYMYQAYAADPQMRVNVGIRRRLAPLMENSRRRIELMNSLLFSLPGTPIIYYGDEIGMGDNIYLGDRNGVRTPMQWTGDRNGGFSRADPARLFAPPIMDAVYGYQAINVEAQERAPYSLLNWMKRMIGLRKQYRVFGRGTIEFLPAQNRKVLIYVRRYEDDTVLCVANLSRTVQPVEVDLARFRGMTPVEMLGLTEFPRIGELPYFLTLGPYAFYWFRLQQVPPALTARTAPETATDVQAPALLVGAAWDTLLDGSVRTLIERELLLPFLRRQRWFGGKARTARTARFVDWGVLARGQHPLFVSLVEVEYEDAQRERYFLPLAVSAGTDARGLHERAPHAVLANVTGARKGVLLDAWMDDRFGRTLFDSIQRGELIRMKRGTLRAKPTARFADVLPKPLEPMRISRMSAEQSNTSIVYGDRMILKLFRRLEPGINPDFEIGRQLTEKVGFVRVPAVTGAFEYEQPAEAPATIAMMQQFVESQADGWSHATDELGRYYDQVENQEAPPLEVPDGLSALARMEPPPRVQDVMGGYLRTAATLGRRTAELHVALASDAADPAFAPEPIVRVDLATVAGGAIGEAQKAVQILESMLEAAESSPDAAARLAPDVVERARAFVSARERLLDGLRSGPSVDFSATKIRIHGDYHLGQVLWAEGDFYIIDFEGEPARPLAQRRGKQSPLKDVAGMLRSLSYAAHAALFAQAAARPSELNRLEPWAQVWQTWSTAAFLRAYFDAADGALFLPAEPTHRDALLRFFMLDKALYELNYELNNRPEWVRIPLWGILDLI
jgi:maltose alpha-D-glucosyltransferase/alpha-amylase